MDERVMLRTWIPALCFGLGLGLGLSISALADVPPPREAGTRIDSATVVQASSVQARVAPSGKARLRVLARGQKAFLGLLSLSASAKVPEHRDPTEEYIYVLEGGGRMWVDDKAYDVVPGSAVYMPARAKVRYENGPKPSRVLQVFAGPSSADKYRAWSKVAAGD